MLAADDRVRGGRRGRGRRRFRVLLLLLLLAVVAGRLVLRGGRGVEGGTGQTKAGLVFFRIVEFEKVFGNKEGRRKIGRH